MRAASDNLKYLLASGRQFPRAELFTITLISGAEIHFTSADQDITYQGTTWASVPMKRSRLRQVIGLAVDTLDVTIYPREDVLADAYTLFSDLANSDALDGATLQLDRLYLTGSEEPVEPLTLFVGRLDIAEQTRAEVKLTIKSRTELLNIKLPKTVIQPGCQHQLFDGGCLASRSTFTSTGTISGTSSQTTLVCDIDGFAAGFFDLGVVTFTSGNNNGIRRTVRAYSPGQILLVTRLPFVPQSGDTFQVVPGCDKREATCLSKFNNKEHYRGFPFVPPPEAIL